MAAAESRDVLLGANSAPSCVESAQAPFAPGCAERLRIYANRVKYSRACAPATVPAPPQGFALPTVCLPVAATDTACYAISLALSVCLLVWVSIEADYPLGNDAVKFWMFVVLDSVLTLFVLLEITVTVLVQGCSNFCRQWTNRADVGVAVLCVAALLLHVLGPAADAALDLEVEEIESVLLIIRFAAQLARLMLLVKKFREQARKQRLEVCMQLDEVDLDLDEVDSPVLATSPPELQPLPAVPTAREPRDERSI